MVTRPKQIPSRTPLTTHDVEDASYKGSAEHKDKRWWGGLPHAYVGPDGKAKRPKKQLTTICPLATAAEQAVATEWVQKALNNKNIKYLEGDKKFPSRIWYRDPQSGQLWMGYCINTILGEYKGWPIEESERVQVFG